MDGQEFRKKARKYFEELHICKMYGVKIPAHEVYSRLQNVLEGSGIEGHTTKDHQTKIPLKVKK